MEDTLPPRCFKVHTNDNVGTMLDDVAAEGNGVILGGAGPESLRLLQPVKLGHKVALAEIAEGAPIVKFGVSIGRATVSILPGQWVHLHNCASDFDQRSQTLDVETGAVTDTKYE